MTHALDQLQDAKHRYHQARIECENAWREFTGYAGNPGVVDIHAGNQAVIDEAYERCVELSLKQAERYEELQRAYRLWREAMIGAMV